MNRRAMNGCVRVLLCALCSACFGCHGVFAPCAADPTYTRSCARSTLAPWIPKLDLRLSLERLQNSGPTLAPTVPEANRLRTSIGASLRWQATVYAAEVPERVSQRGPALMELSPAAWLAPCELNDLTCFDELAEVEQDIAAALRAAR